MRRPSIREVIERGTTPRVSVFEIGDRHYAIDHAALGSRMAERARAKLSEIFQRREVEGKRISQFDSSVLN